MAGARRRVLVLGLDGGTFDLLDPWMKAGELPFLKSLSARGIRAPLTSVFPPKTIPAWYSFATGQDPGSLGIFGFTEPDGGPGRSRIIQTYRPVEALWDRLSRAGATVGVLNFPVGAGYPLNGFVVPGMLSEDAATYPEGLRRSLEGRRTSPSCPRTVRPTERRGSTRRPAASSSTGSTPRSSRSATTPTSSSRCSGRPTGSSTSTGPS